MKKKHIYIYIYKKKKRKKCNKKGTKCPKVKFNKNQCIWNVN